MKKNEEVGDNQLLNFNQIMRIYLKNMVCQGTKKFVLLELKNMGLKLKSFESEQIEFKKDLSKDEELLLQYNLKKYGLEIHVEKDKQAVLPQYQEKDHISEYEYLMEREDQLQPVEASLV
ncbi:MAG TPA: hypothetical protein VHO50_02635 [Bacteroidales bacterium]|nr:hypothetical protein [Bacteroidales bacterium]